MARQEMTKHNTLGQYFQKLRNKNNLTLHQLSMFVDIDSPMLSRIERGKRLPTLEQLTRLAEYYHLSEKELRARLFAEKIITVYGINDTTYNAMNLVKKRISSYIKNLEATSK